MKRFLLFCFDNYDAGGGWDDFKGAFDSVEEAEFGINKRLEAWHIVDLQKMRIVKHGYKEDRFTRP